MSTQNPEDGGFLSRWSRRKTQVQQGAATTGDAREARPAAAAVNSPEPSARDAGSGASAGVATRPGMPTAAPGADSPAAAGPVPATGAPEQVPPRSAAHPSPSEPRPTLEDVEQLDAKSDYRAFVARDVDPDVRNAAFKKLFHSDPHFNVMDGLDVYIDDYNTPNPLPVAIMKTLVQARALGLIDDELKEQDPPPADPVDVSGASTPADANPEGAETDGGLADAHDGVEPTAGSDCAPQGAQLPPAEGAEPPLVELQLVPDTACNDERLTPASGAPAAAGTVVPFPRRPGSADPA